MIWVPYELNDVEIRVLGSLIEKEMTTPEYYPLSLNALVNACNQKSNREPVVNYDEETVRKSLETLRAKGLAMIHSGRDVRVPKFAQRLSAALNLGNREMALLGVLLLRGPQTAGELKDRAHRAHPFDDLESVEACLRRLAESEPKPLVVKLERQPGTRESRYAHLLGDHVAANPAANPEAAAPAGAGAPAALAERVAAIEAELATLKREFKEFRRQFEN
jgi:uncharacterized protein YceH (UPF0502 family)